MISAQAGCDARETLRRRHCRSEPRRPGRTRCIRTDYPPDSEDGPTPSLGRRRPVDAPMQQCPSITDLRPRARGHAEHLVTAAASIFRGSVALVSTPAPAGRYRARTEGGGNEHVRVDRRRYRWLGECRHRGGACDRACEDNGAATPGVQRTTTAKSEPIPAGTVALDANGTRRRLHASPSCVRTERDGRLRAAQIAAVREPQARRGAQTPVATPAAAAGPRPA